MKRQNGATLVIAIVLLAVITMVAAYAIEGSTLQSKMMSSSIISINIFHEVNNELMSNVRFYDDPENISDLVTMEEEDVVFAIETRTYPINDTNISSTLIFTGEQGCEGSDIQLGGTYTCPTFELTAVGELRSSASNQSLGLKALRPNIETLTYDPTSED